MAKEKALIFEPHAALRSKYLKILDAHDIKIGKVADVDEVYELLKKSFYDIVILNYSIAQKEGEKVLKKIVASLPSQTSIIITGEDNKKYYETSLKSGAYTYFVNTPFKEEEFDSILKRIIERKLLVTENTRLKSEATLLKCSKNIALTIEQKDFSSALLKSILKLTNCSCGFFAIHKKEDGKLVIQASRGAKKSQSRFAFFGINQAFLKDVLKKGEPIIIENPINAENIDSDIVAEEAITSLFLWPLIKQKEDFGIIVTGQRGDQETLSQKKMFYVNKLLADSVIAMQNVLTFQRVSGLTIKDDITSAYNRRFFESFIEEEIQRSKRYKLCFSVIFIDLDNFKRVNELYGHSTGSKMLGKVAERMFDQVRSVDRVVRYGGDEFCIILPETDSKGAFRVARRIRKGLESKPFRFSKIEDTFITASFGISTYPRHGSTKKKLISLADKAMFEAKKRKDDPIASADDLKKTG